jgi:hypothetical protein
MVIVPSRSALTVDTGGPSQGRGLAPDVRRPHNVPAGSPPDESRAIGSRRMFLFYFNKLGWLGSILVSVALTLVLILAFRLLNG